MQRRPRAPSGARGPARGPEEDRCSRSIGPHDRPKRGPDVSCWTIPPRPLSQRFYFYELHEGDDDVFSDLLLVHDEQIEPEDFFELVQAIREKVQPTFEEDTLIEAIALELEREHGFTFVSDARLTASVHVSPIDDENRLISIDDEVLESAEYRSLFAELDPNAELN